MIDWVFGAWSGAAPPGSEPSRAIPRRLGFTQAGTLREVFRVREDFHDLEVWSLLRDEWAPEPAIACQPGSGSRTTRTQLPMSEC